MHPRLLGTASQIIVLALLLGLPESGRAQPSEWAPPLTTDGQPISRGLDQLRSDAVRSAERRGY